MESKQLVDKELITTLHKAHARSIESAYRARMSVRGDPEGCKILDIDGSRVFLSREPWSWSNRAILSGNETPETIEKILEAFSGFKTECHIELHPANFHFHAPQSWEADFANMLFDKGLRFDSFRSVWFCEPTNVEIKLGGGFRIERFDYDDDLDRQVADSYRMIKNAEFARKREDIIRVWERCPGYIHYNAYKDDEPCGTATLFIDNDIAFLVWGFTRSEYRNQGVHHMLIRRRISDAASEKCRLVFTVTDFNIQSSHNVQRCGMRLAYNYVMMAKEFGEGNSK
ncbi:GNAT family N-acetyltransferase [candidate division WOR-3 bacterium]|nr:GNAT family N-acetyltransferase [candidate division WOR-3 bacterium]